VITSISMDHMQFLGDTVAKIAAEKAAIMKPGVPSVTVAQVPEAAAVIEAAAATIGASLKRQGQEWKITPEGGRKLAFTGQHHTWTVPRPSLLGRHQFDNAGAALAALDQAGFAIPDFALQQGLKNIAWPARSQRLRTGPLVDALPPAWELWLDGGHNPGGGQAIAQLAQDEWRDAPLHLIVGMLSTKEAEGFLRHLASHAVSLTVIPIPGSDIAYTPAQLSEAAKRAGFSSIAEAESAGAALARISKESPSPHARILICGALYLAGEILKKNG
jgi:dihydrofolate synthase / folylpolyglutamate synthase